MPLDADSIRFLTSEHDKRVIEYMVLEEMLPLPFERHAMIEGVAALCDAGKPCVAARLQYYLDRLQKADL